MNSASPERDAVLADFHQRFASNPDVIDKWFSVQALANRPDVLENVKALIGHRDFTIVNPNRLRNPRWHMVLVAAAGPLTNIVLAFVAVAAILPPAHRG